MATVVNVPGDKRFEQIGLGLGSIGAGVLQRNKEKQEREAKRQALMDALGIVQAAASSEDPVSQETMTSLGGVLGDAGLEDQLPQFVNMLSNFKQEQAKQRTQQIGQESVVKLAAVEPKVEETFVEGQTVPQALNLANIRAALANQAQQRKKVSLTLFKGGEQRVIRIDPALNDQEIDEQIAADPKLSGFVRTKPKATAAPRQSTQTERDDQAILTLRGEKNTTQNRAKATNLRLGRNDVNRELGQRFGGKIITDRFGDMVNIDFGGKQKELTLYGIATGLVDDVLFSGTDPNDAANEIEAAARQVFQTGAFIARRIRDQGANAVQEFLNARRIDAPEIVQYFRDLQAAATDSEAFRRVAEILNPTMSAAEIDEKVKERFPNG